jgi:hypothetical protein
LPYEKIKRVVFGVDESTICRHYSVFLKSISDCSKKLPAIKRTSEPKVRSSALSIKPNPALFHHAKPGNIPAKSLLAKSFSQNTV